MTFASCLAIQDAAARIAEASRARSSVGRAPPSHGGGQGFESPRVHFLFVAICRLNVMIKRRRRHALGLLCSNPAERPVATASPRPPSRTILNESTPCSPAFVRITSLRTLAGFPFPPRSRFVRTLYLGYHPDRRRCLLMNTGLGRLAHHSPRYISMWPHKISC
jgi:hypothetical protein